MDLRDLYKRTFAAVEAQSGTGKSRLGKATWAGRKVVIYGAGGFGRELARILVKRQDELLGFLDQKATGQTVCENLRAYPLDSDESKKWLREKPVVLIGVFNCANSLREISNGLRGCGFSEVFTPVEFYSELADELGWRYWLGKCEDYSGAARLIEQAYLMWADDESRRLFLETLLFRLESDLTALTTISEPDSQYADPTVPRFDEPLNMVDGGAYLGDSVECLLRHRYEIARLYAFEPDRANFRQLRSAVSRILPRSQTSLWPCGVWSSTDQLRFSADGSGASKLSETGSVVVPVVALDDVLINQPVNLIKLDIEGAEPDALQGAMQIIQKNRPGLAICLYHYPHHLWTLPLWVNNLEIGYRLYYRAHLQNSFDTVLYAVKG
ncbi:MAG TPA: FkbM family methyltransferase [Verrucomicrobiae bacterium]|jgi:FkbM family methyltransferase